jgi:hypothetical protein
MNGSLRTKGKKYAGALTIAAVAFAFIGYRNSGSFLAALGSSAFGCLVGLLMFTAIDKKTSKRLLALGLPDGDYPVRVAMSCYLAADPSVVIDACLAAVRKLPNFVSIKRHDSPGHILVKTRSWSDAMFGERVTIRVAAKDSGTELHLESVPALASTTVDSGLNFQNVALVLRSLQRAIEVSDIEPKELFSKLG